MNDTQLEVWNFIQELNRVWTVKNEPEKLKDYFHRDMIAMTHVDNFRVMGGEACVAGWKGFCDNAKIHFWKEFEPLVSVFGDGLFAVVSYRFEMSFDMNGHTINMKGRDMFSVVKENGRWWVVSDQYSEMR